MEIVLTDIQILATLICAVLSIIAYRTRIAPIAVIPAIGFFIIGFEIYTASENLLILALYYAVAIIQFVLCFGQKYSRRRD